MHGDKLADATASQIQSYTDSLNGRGGGSGETAITGQRGGAASVLLCLKKGLRLLLVYWRAVMWRGDSGQPHFYQPAPDVKLQKVKYFSGSYAPV